MKACVRQLAAGIQNLSAEAAAAVLVAGVVLGTFPVYGCPTVLCILAVLAFRLDAAVLHVVNQLVAPLQLALVLPFARLGERVLGHAGTTAPASVLPRFGVLTLHAVTGWLCAGLPFGILLYMTLACVLRRRRLSGFSHLETPA